MRDDSPQDNWSGELSNPGNSDVCTRVPSESAYARASRIHPLDILEQAGCIAATKLAWIAVIVNGSKASGPLIYKRYGI